LMQILNLLTHIIKYLIQWIWCFCFCQYNLLDWLHSAILTITTEKAQILYFLNLVYFLSLVGLWQNHVLYWPLTGLMWRNRTPFGKRVVNNYGSVCHYYWFFFPWNFTHVSKNRWGTSCVRCLYPLMTISRSVIG
jgi:hypothetical protein